MANYSYRRLGRHYLDTRFWFRKSRTSPGPLTGEVNGTVQVCLIIHQVSYGPYTTGIRTTQAIWDAYKGTGGTQSRGLANDITDYESRAETAYGELSRNKEVIDGQALVKAIDWLHNSQASELVGFSMEPNSPFALVSLARVCREFLEVKQGAIEGNRRKRSSDQIAHSTFSTYSKRWVLLQGYLSAVGHKDYPVINIDYPFAVRLKEWLTKQKQASGKSYQIATINKVISFLKLLMTYSMGKGYIKNNPVASFACRGGAAINPKPLTEEQINYLETCELPPMLRHVCDSWLVAAELCLHYSDFIRLPQMTFKERPGRAGQPLQRFVQHDRQKQTGSALIQTVNVTQRAERLLQKWGVKGLFYRHSALYSKYLKVIAQLADLRDENGDLIGLQFGQGRDTGLTFRAVQGANSVQLAKMAGWRRASYADHYIGDGLGIVEGFVNNAEQTANKPNY